MYYITNIPWPGLLGPESKVERLSVLLQFSLVDELIREHRPPGSSQVVVGVQNMRRSVESVELWNLQIKKKKINISKMKNKLIYLEARESDLSFIFIEELGDEEEAGVLHGGERTVQVGEVVMLQGSSASRDPAILQSWESTL